MPIDTSIYGNIQLQQAPSLLDSQQKAMSLSQMALQNAQSQRAFAEQDAMRQAMAQNVNPDGTINRPGLLSALAKTSPSGFMTAQQHLAGLDRATAEAQEKQSDAMQKSMSTYKTAMDAVKSVPESDRADVYKQQLNNLVQRGLVNPQQMGIPTEYNPEWFHGAYEHVLNQFGGKSADYLGNQKTQADTRKSLAEAAKAESETYKRNPAVLGQSNDPAVLVPNLVPKEHQAQAFKEIDAAENTRKMSKSILDSFDQAVADTRGAGRVTSLLKTPRSVGALHQSMQPTFKDLEGTVRQAAMDNTFKNITPNAADTDNDIATKRQALADYLQSKLAAPTARAYGIDLAKFQSTAPYESKPTRPGGSAGMIPTAYADDGGKQAAPAPQHRAGDVILYKGNHYRVGADGDTLEPVGSR